MKERPILFSAPMVRAILAGSKTQTRRVVKPQPDFLGSMGDPTTPFKTFDFGLHGRIECPYGEPGDRLYVREAWRTLDELDPHSGGRISEMCLDAGYLTPWAPIQYEADKEQRNWQHVGTPPHLEAPKPGRYRHGRFMPRWASRILLEVVSVRVERLNDISAEDCIAEGAAGGHGAIPKYDYAATPHEHYRHVWKSINGPGSWDANPWVWVVEFKRVQA